MKPAQFGLCLDQLCELERLGRAIDPALTPGRAAARVAGLANALALRQSPRSNLALIAATALVAMAAIDRETFADPGPVIEEPAAEDPHAPISAAARLRELTVLRDENRRLRQQLAGRAAS